MRMWLSGQKREIVTFKERTINTVHSGQGLTRGKVLGVTASGGGEATACPPGLGHDTLRNWSGMVHEEGGEDAGERADKGERRRELCVRAPP